MSVNDVAHAIYHSRLSRLALAAGGSLVFALTGCASDPGAGGVLEDKSDPSKQKDRPKVADCPYLGVAAAQHVANAYLHSPGAHEAYKGAVVDKIRSYGNGFFQVNADQKLKGIRTAAGLSTDLGGKLGNLQQKLPNAVRSGVWHEWSPGPDKTFMQALQKAGVGADGFHCQDKPGKSAPAPMAPSGSTTSATLAAGPADRPLALYAVGVSR